MTGERPPRPRLAFRVGVTGARDLGSRPDRMQAGIRDQVTALLRMVGDTLASVALLRDAHSTYGADPRPKPRLLSPLAEGADRLVAEVATDLGYELDIALPFARADYAADFTETASAAAFARWLEPERAAGIRPYLALDGGRGEHETASYEAVGRLVVRNCDLLVAVWDGRPARGRGGTAEIVRFGVQYGLPVWWIDATGAHPPRLLRSSAELRAPQDAPRAGEAMRILARLVDRMLLPSGDHRHDDGPIGRAMDRLLGAVDEPMDSYLHGGYLPDDPRREWFGRIRSTLGRQRLVQAPEPVPAPDGPAAYWQAVQRPADQASTAYADRYRSCLVRIILLTVLAVICAVAALAQAPWELAASASEIVVLGVILALVVTSGRRDWRGRWIACRLLAELCRKQAVLSAIGWSLPTPELRRNLRANGIVDGGQDIGRRMGEAEQPEAWVFWYFGAMQRAAPLQRGDLAGPRLTAVREHARDALAEDQRRFGRDRRLLGRRSARRLAWSGGSAFLATLILVLTRFALLVTVGHPENGGLAVAAGVEVAQVIFGVLAAALPAVSAAILGIRAYAELEPPQGRSGRVARVTSATARRIDRLDLGRPLASQDLAAEVMAASSAMLQQVAGRADLFRGGAMEAE